MGAADAMLLIYVVAIVGLYAAESAGNPVLNAFGVDQQASASTRRKHEGKNASGDRPLILMADGIDVHIDRCGESIARIHTRPSAGWSVGHDASRRVVARRVRIRTYGMLVFVIVAVVCCRLLVAGRRVPRTTRSTVRR